MGGKAKREARATTCGGRCPEAVIYRAKVVEQAACIQALTGDRDRAIAEAGKLSAENLRLREDLAVAHAECERLRRELAAAESRQRVRP